VTRLPGGAGPLRLPIMFFGPPSTSTRFLLGVEPADGRRAPNLEEQWPPGADRDLALDQGSGSGSELIVEQSWEVYPLPPPDVPPGSRFRR